MSSYICQVSLMEIYIPKNYFKWVRKESILLRKIWVVQFYFTVRYNGKCKKRLWSDYYWRLCSKSCLGKSYHYWGVNAWNGIIRNLSKYCKVYSRCLSLLSILKLESRYFQWLPTNLSLATDLIFLKQL